jgi:FtsP/CotA-like multicopper oxidase with cupredoxin domain
MPRTGLIDGVDYYEIALKQFQQQILPAGMPATTVWSYGSAGRNDTFNYPAFTIEARYRRPVRVKWINGLVDDATGNYLPHLLAVDQTLHWANPSGGTQGRDMHGSTGAPYGGPVPIVTHLHGGHNAQESDGFAEAWYLPAANNIPAEYARVGTWYDAFRSEFSSKFGVDWEPGSATFQCQNDQRAGTLWYHDHTLGMTRLNVYAGPAGFYLLRFGPGDLPPAVLPGPAPGVRANRFGRFYEIPIAIQDRSFNMNGSLFYPTSRTFFEQFNGSAFTGPYYPEGRSDVPPIWNPEFFGNTVVVNGRTWPYLDVEQRRYRFRILNGCNSRFLILKIVSDPMLSRPASAALPFWQIGGEGGFLPRPVERNDILLAPAERADVIVDFSRVPEGTQLYLINEGPDEPFGGGVPSTDFPPADVGTTGQVTRFQVVASLSRDTSRQPDTLTLPAFRPLPEPTLTRMLSLNELASTYPAFDGPIAALLGTLQQAENWDEDITENPALNSVERWAIHNFTEDAHPIHIHEVQFQIEERRTFDGQVVQPPLLGEEGFKDTVIAFPGQVTRVRARFDLPGLYAWHCHIVEHEDNEMMRPFFVGPNPPQV